MSRTFRGIGALACRHFLIISRAAAGIIEVESQRPPDPTAALKSTSMATPSRSFFAPPGLEPGDRFEVTPIGGTGRLSLPRVLGPDGFPIEQIEDPAGRPLDLALDAAAGSIVVPKLAEAVARSQRSALAGVPGAGPVPADRRAGRAASGQRLESSPSRAFPSSSTAGDWPVVQAASAAPAGWSWTSSTWRCGRPGWPRTPGSTG